MKLNHSLKPRVYFLSLFLTLALSPFAYSQVDVVIQSFDSSGQLRFNEVPNAEHYRIEWAPSVDGPWTNFAAASLSLDLIAATGSGTVTSMVPMLYRVVALVTNEQSTPPGMSLIPAGEFVMGDTFEEGSTDEFPPRTMFVSAFYMDRYEVTKALWDQVRTWGMDQGYNLSIAQGKAPNHPVHSISWFDAVKWCNARSEMDELTPVYYTDDELTTVYKTGEIAPFANWAANGYRLPTEAEWEKAARGGEADTRFPWTDYTNKISWTKANYYGLSDEISYDLDGGSGAYHPTFALSDFPYTSPVGYFAPNGYGLYDMAGNVWEWCWDWYGINYYDISPSADPRGPAIGDHGLPVRVRRGGFWEDSAFMARVAVRDFYWAEDASWGGGFRCARGL
jgi:sulfatase modifying factor 1